ncbi:hypothetical protein EDD16DRAFT_28133 [Pisolithus croceorrhizus]|nr:hypothetical protein EDD16DRAFT_28133 [Pisolithus croceorrhizus]
MDFRPLQSDRPHGTCTMLHICSAVDRSAPIFIMGVRYGGGCSVGFEVTAVPSLRQVSPCLSPNVSPIIDRYTQIVPRPLFQSRLRDFVRRLFRCKAPSFIPQYSDVRRALVVHLTNGDLSLGANRSKRSRIIQGRSLLEEQILCNENYQKYSLGVTE